MNAYANATSTPCALFLINIVQRSTVKSVDDQNRTSKERGDKEQLKEHESDALHGVRKDAAEDTAMR